MTEDLLTQLRDYGQYHEEQQAQIPTPESPLAKDVDLIVVKDGQSPDTKPKHWGMLATAAAIVVAVLVVGGVVIANSGGEDDSDVTTQPSGASDIAGDWEYTDRPAANAPMEQVRMEYHDDGTYAFIAWPDVRADYGRYEFTDGELTVYTDGGRGCTPDGLLAHEIEEDAMGHYRLIFTTADSVTFEVITDSCGPRQKVLDGAQLARIAGE